MNPKTSRASIVLTVLLLGLLAAPSRAQPVVLKFQTFKPYVDHFNTMEFHGHEGIAKSVSLYRRLFSDLTFVVNEQVTEDDRVASRWTLRGTNRGRMVQLSGITISRLEDDRIVEDWGSTDSLELLRQLGIWRSLLMVATEWRLLLDLGRS